MSLNASPSPPVSRKRLDGVRYFLTYAQVNNDTFTAESFATALFQLSPAPAWLEVAAEKHQDDGLHYHAVVVFRERIQKPLTWFDVDGYHPNIRAIRNGGRDLYHRRHYIRKEEKGKHDVSHRDEPCDYTGVPAARGAVPDYTNTEAPERDDWGTIVEESVDRADFLQRVKSSFPKDFVLKHDQIIGYATRYFAQPAPYQPPWPRESYTVPPCVDAWIAEIFSEVGMLAFDARSRVRLLSL